MILYTIGYEGTTLDDFINCLMAHKVTLIMDVRKYAVSGNKDFHFSSSEPARVYKFDDWREKYGDGVPDYIHLPAFGMPDDGRDAARKGDYVRAWDIYTKRLNKIDSYWYKFVKNKISEIPSEKIALLCMEENPEKCHRHLLVNRLKEDFKDLNMEIKHLFPRKEKRRRKNKSHSLTSE